MEGKAMVVKMDVGSDKCEKAGKAAKRREETRMARGFEGLSRRDRRRPYHAFGNDKIAAGNGLKPENNQVSDKSSCPCKGV